MSLLIFFQNAAVPSGSATHYQYGPRLHTYRYRTADEKPAEEQRPRQRPAWQGIATCPRIQVGGRLAIKHAPATWTGMAMVRLLASGSMRATLTMPRRIQGTLNSSRHRFYARSQWRFHDQFLEVQRQEEMLIEMGIDPDGVL